METVNVVINEASDSSSEKISEKIPKEILPPKPKVVQEIVDQEPVSPWTPSVVQVSQPKSMKHEFRCMINLLILHNSINIIYLNIVQ